MKLNLALILLFFPLYSWGQNNAQWSKVWQYTDTQSISTFKYERLRYSELHMQRIAGEHEKLKATLVIQIQNTLNAIHANITGRRNYSVQLYEAWRLLNELYDKCPEFDCLPFHYELNCYSCVMPYTDLPFAEQKAIYDKQWDILTNERKTVLTDFDIKLASTFKGKDLATPSGMAMLKVERTGKREKDRINDSVSKARDSVESVLERRARARQAGANKMLAVNGAQLAKKYDSATVTRILNNELWIGMTDQMLLDERGKPIKKSRTVSKKGATEIWEYSYQNVKKSAPKVILNIHLRNHRVFSWKLTESVKAR